MKTKNCKTCSNTFSIDSEDSAFYTKLNVPEPNLCPDCRERSRWAFRNARNYYSRCCDLCKKQIISVYDPKRIKNVYCVKCWWSDAWDAKSFGKDYDFTRTFFEQYKELHNSVPRLAMQNDNTVQSENCEYTYDFALGKNCYLMVNSWKDENCMFGQQVNYVKDSLENFTVFNSQNMYECAVSEECYNAEHCVACRGCMDVVFGFDLRNCSNCIACAGLRNKKYCIWNKQYTKEEYEKKKAELELNRWSSRESLKKEFADFIKSIPRSHSYFLNCQDCTGDYLFKSKNARSCYFFAGLNNCKYMQFGDGAKDCQDCTGTGGPEFCYYSVTPDNGNGNAFTVYCWKSNSIFYSENCHTSQDLFGCVGLRNGKYSILDKQYSKEEYQELRKKIIEQMKTDGEWGEFFPSNITPFAYNETEAQEWFPLSKEKATSLGYYWEENIGGMYGKETIQWDKISDNINEVDETILFNVLACIECNRNYKIIKQEFEFYKKHSIPVPRYCVNCRDFKRKSLLNPRYLWNRKCANCTNEFKTTYAPERPEKVFCEECYLKKIA